MSEAEGRAAGRTPPWVSAADRPAFQAVVLVHGMGEQRPMDTVTGFAEAVWGTDSEIAGETDVDKPNQLWSKPDAKTGSLELRRITTRRSVSSEAYPNGVRTDFYELYWADLTAGSTWDQLTGWIRYLLFRPWSKVPRPVRGAWIVLWVLSALVVALGLVALLPASWWGPGYRQTIMRPVMLVAAAGILAGIHGTATATFGRVVRYTRADPVNIAARAAVRERGLELLRALHQDPSYGRVVLVGHSLGSILAYDLLSYFWSEQSQARSIEEGTETFFRLRELEELAAKLVSAGSGEDPRADVEKIRTEFRMAQASLRKSMSLSEEGDPGRRWLISDLVTVGSPLTHAEFLLAADRADLDRRREARELPVAPPYREVLDPENRAAAEAAGLPLPGGTGPATLMVYPDPSRPRSWMLHHAAPFAAVRWTNVHDHATWVWRGDLISGPLAPAFGPGILDVDLARIDGQSRRFTHTRYWAADGGRGRIGAIRRAVNILDV